MRASRERRSAGDQSNGETQKVSALHDVLPFSNCFLEVMLEEVLQLEDECSLNPTFRRSSELNLHQDERRSCGARAFDKEQRYVSIICAGYVMSLPMLAIPDAHPPAIGDGAAESHVRAENDQPEMRLFSVRHAIVT